jgi:hypothetical protein
VSEPTTLLRSLQYPNGPQTIGGKWISWNPAIANRAKLQNDLTEELKPFVSLIYGPFSRFGKTADLRVETMIWGVKR